MGGSPVQQWPRPVAKNVVDVFYRKY